MRYLDLAKMPRANLCFRSERDFQDWLKAFGYESADDARLTCLTHPYPEMTHSVHVRKIKPGWAPDYQCMMVVVNLGRRDSDGYIDVRQYEGMEMKEAPAPYEPPKPGEPTERTTPEGVVIWSKPNGGFYGKKKTFIAHSIDYRVHGPAEAVRKWMTEQISYYHPAAYGTHFNEVREENGVLYVEGNRSTSSD